MKKYQALLMLILPIVLMIGMKFSVHAVMGSSITQPSSYPCDISDAVILSDAVVNFSKTYNTTYEFYTFNISFEPITIETGVYCFSLPIYSIDSLFASTTAIIADSAVTSPRLTSHVLATSGNAKFISASSSYFDMSRYLVYVAFMCDKPTDIQNITFTFTTRFQNGSNLNSTFRGIAYARCFPSSSSGDVSIVIPDELSSVLSSQGHDISDSVANASSVEESVYSDLDVSSRIESIDSVIDVDLFSGLSSYTNTALFFSTIVSGIWSALGDFAIPLTLILTLLLVSVILGIFGRLHGGE